MIFQPQGYNISHIKWLNQGMIFRPHGSHSGTVHHNQSGLGHRSALIRPIVVPKFVSNPTLPVKPGYREAHKLYDDMRQFFAQKAMSVHASEVVVIKVTLMSWKPGNRNPSIVSV